MEYKTINMYLTPLTSEVSQMRITDKANEMANDGWHLMDVKIIDECNVMLVFNRKS